MINIGKNNRWALVQCLREAFEREVAAIPKTMVHNFSHANPQYALTVKVDAELVHRVIVEAELADARKRIARLEKRIGPEAGAV